MKFDFLSERIQNALQFVDKDKLYEIRLRKGFPIALLVGNAVLFLTDNGGALLEEDAIVAEESDIDGVVYAATDFSVYANDEKIRCGFLSVDSGIRIGIAGECVWESGRISTIKNFTSLNIRIPHNVIGCSNRLYSEWKKRNMGSVLIISPPGMGKTTLLKDIIRNLKETKKNILVIDERGELGVELDNPFCDVIRFAEKKYAFSYAIRSLAPQIVVTDELGTDDDFRFVEETVRGGMAVFASMHGRSVAFAQKRFGNSFGAYILLDDRDVGLIKEIVC